MHADNGSIKVKLHEGGYMPERHGGLRPRHAPRREVCRSCINGVFLDELEPGRGVCHPVVPACGLLCGEELDR